MFIQGLPGSAELDSCHPEPYLRQVSIEILGPRSFEASLRQMSGFRARQYLPASPRIDTWMDACLRHGLGWHFLDQHSEHGRV